MSNPARRAFAVFQFVRTFQDKTCSGAWEAAFELVGNRVGPEGLFQRLVELYAELDSAEKLARQKFSDEQAAVKLKYMAKLKASLGHQGTQAWYDSYVSEAMLHCLENLAHDLDDEPQIQPSELDAIQKELTALFEQVRSSSLKPQLKRWILGWIAKIQNGITHFKIYGVKGLQDALIAIQGEAWFLAPALKQVEQGAPEVYSGLEGIFSKVVKVVDFTDKLVRLCDSSIVAPMINLGLKGLGLKEHD